MEESLKNADIRVRDLQIERDDMEITLKDLKAKLNSSEKSKLSFQKEVNRLNAKIEKAGFNVETFLS